MKDNICPLCDGLGYTPGTDPSTNIKYCEDVKCVCEDGTRIGYLENWIIWGLEDNLERSGEINGMLRSWIKDNTTCKTCKGDQYKTFGMCPCSECGLIGQACWPG